MESRDALRRGSSIRGILFSAGRNKDDGLAQAPVLRFHDPGGHLKSLDLNDNGAKASPPETAELTCTA